MRLKCRTTTELMRLRTWAERRRDEQQQVGGFEMGLRAAYGSVIDQIDRLLRDRAVENDSLLPLFVAADGLPVIDWIAALLATFREEYDYSKCPDLDAYHSMESAVDRFVKSVRSTVTVDADKQTALIEAHE